MGDFFTDPIPPGHDAIIVANILHLFLPEHNRTLLQHTRASVAAGTRLLIVDLLTDPTHTQPVGATLMAGAFLVMAGHGDVYSEAEVREWLQETGWRPVETTPLAGLDRHPKDKVNLTDEALIEEFHRVASLLGKIPTWAVFAHHATVSADVVRRRFGGLQGTLSRYRDWLEAHHANSPFLEQLQTKSRHEIPVPPTAVETLSQQPTSSWEKIAGPVYGAPINFRGLRHAPVNEQGVVFLFGMVAYELGFIVEAVHAAFPDCEAKRCIDPKEQRWQRVRIEFEYKSRAFRDHGHDAHGCDLVVCWEHNWPECPLEVLS